MANEGREKILQEMKKKNKKKIVKSIESLKTRDQQCIISLLISAH